MCFIRYLYLSIWTLWSIWSSGLWPRAVSNSCRSARVCPRTFSAALRCWSSPARCSRCCSWRSAKTTSRARLSARKRKNKNTRYRYHSVIIARVYFQTVTVMRPARRSGYTRSLRSHTHLLCTPRSIPPTGTRPVSWWTSRGNTWTSTRCRSRCTCR